MKVLYDGLCRGWCWMAFRWVGRFGGWGGVGGEMWGDAGFSFLFLCCVGVVLSCGSVMLSEGRESVHVEDIWLDV